MDWYSQEAYCKDLPSKATPEIGTILVTGATGYIGGRLVNELTERGYRVRALVRSHSEAYSERWPEAEIVVADALKPGLLRKALKGVSVAYYLMHPMLATSDEDSDTDLRAAINFSKGAEEEHLKRIIYLGSHSDTEQHHSRCLHSRFRVVETLKGGKVPVTILWSGIIIGSGSASFEILNNIVKNYMVYFMPPWASNRCQPISVRDVIKYLVGVLETSETSGHAYDIGGEEVLTYREMIRIFARLKRNRHLVLPTPFSSIRFYSYIISLFSPVPARIVTCQLESVKRKTEIRALTIHKLINFRTIRYKVMLLRALSRQEQDKIATRWSDAYPPAHELMLNLHELTTPPRYVQRYWILTFVEPDQLFESICQIGGKKGWFHTNWLWRMRGLIDRVLMGVGTARGRRSASSLRIDDVIDFWRVEEMIKERKLLLRAEMKLPGKAWLEFRIDPERAPVQNRLTITAYFQPRGLFGRIYWYWFLPFHSVIFKDLLKQLIRE